MTDSSATSDAPVPDPVPDADRAEQEMPAIDAEVEEAPVTIAPDVPEADAIEQAHPVPLPDDDEAPR
ncbi:MAG: hypothetical protein ACRD03_06975 [Acidimicrobiales bacterium]